MKRLLPVSLAVSVLAACSQTPGAPDPIGLEPMAQAPNALDEAAMRLRPDSPGADTAGGKLHFNLLATEGPGDLIIRYRNEAGTATSARSLKMERLVALRATNRRAEILRLLRDPNIEFIEPDAPVRAVHTPNDPGYARQWGLPKIQAPLAWDQTFGANSPLVAVIDTGVNANHPDLAGQIQAGYDFVNRDADPTDDQGHGTHVAGIIVAKGDNGIGALGVAPQARVLSIKALSASGSGSTAGIVESINYAVQQGAKVINLSLGSPFKSLAMEYAIRDAIAAGCVVVAAAGNDGKNMQVYPAAYPGVLSVGSTAPNDARSSFSNFGTWVRMAAPGSSIYATYKNSYATLSGTSMAAPHVAGAAALVYAVHPTWTAQTVQTALETTGDATTGFAPGSPLRLNASRALKYTPPVAPSPTPTPTPSPAPSASPKPTPTPTPVPTASPQPSASPTATPSPAPTPSPTPAQTPSPTPAQTPSPNATPVPSPSASAAPIQTPKPGPIVLPTPTPTPSASPSPTPTPTPSNNGPLKLEVSSIRVTNSSIHVTWKTDVPSKSTIELGTKPNQFTARSQSNVFTTQRTWDIVRLPRKTTIYIRLTNVSRAGAEAQTQTFSATTN